MKVKISKLKFSKNFLDKSFQKVLLPTQITQHVVFLSKFSINSNCIMPNGFLYILISLVGMFFFIFLNLNDGNIRDIFQKFTKSKFLWLSFTLNYVGCLSGYILFYFHNVFSRKKHVEMIVTIQKAFRIICFDKYNLIIFDNWSFLLRHYLVYVLFIFLRLDISVTVYFFSLVYFDVYASYSVCLSKLLHGGILTWISEIEYYTRVSLIVNNEEDKKWTTLFQVYTDLMKTFSIFKNVFQIPVSISVMCLYLLTRPEVWFQSSLSNFINNF